MIIKKLVVKTGSRCTLKCAKCGEFNPYMKDRMRTYDIDMNVLVNDISKILDVVENIELIDIAGGEALVHKDLDVLIRYVGEEKRINRVHIVSNGTVVPDVNVLNYLQTYSDKVEIRISDYSAAGVDNSLAINLYNENNIRYKLLKDMIWLDKSDTSYKNYDDEVIRRIPNECSTYREKGYFTLINGKISAHCPTAGSLMHFLAIYGECEGEFYNIRDTDCVDVRTLEKMDIGGVLHACQYCVPSFLASKCLAGEQIS